MLTSILIGLDGSRESESALELGLRWAKEFNATVVGLAIVDEPGIQVSEVGMVAEAHHWHATAPLLAEAHRQARENLQEFDRQCVAVNVRHQVIEDVGSPYVQILEELQRFDLLLLGQRTHFNFGRRHVRSDETLGRVLRDSSRPVVTVPETLREGNSIVVAYDGSLQSARALQAFEATGLAESARVHVVSVAEEKIEAARHAERAIDYLRFHEISAESHHLASTEAAATLILNQVNELSARLLVLGAYGRPLLQEFFLGSTTRTLLKKSPVSLFLFH